MSSAEAGTARVILSRRSLVRGLSLLLAVVAVLVLPVALDNSRTFLVSRIFVFAIIAISLTVLTGWAGQLSLGHFAGVREQGGQHISNVAAKSSLLRALSAYARAGACFLRVD